MSQDDHNHTTSYTVNGEEQTTTEKKLTPVQIMQHAGIDPTKNYLIEIEGNEQKSFKDEPNEELSVHNGEKFITNFFGPKPVS